MRHAERCPRRAQTVELLGCPVPGDRQVVAAGTQVLPDGDDGHPDAAQVGHGGHDLVLAFAQSHHQAGLGHQAGLPGPGEHAQAARVPGRGPHGPLQPGHGLNVVVQDVGPRLEDRIQ